MSTKNQHSFKKIIINFIDTQTRKFEAKHKEELDKIKACKAEFIKELKNLLTDFEKEAFLNEI